MRKLLLLLVMSAPLMAAAQTKKIAHRSHSGSAATFSPTSGADDFGVDSRMYKRMREQEDSTRRAAAADSARRAAADPTLRRDTSHQQAAQQHKPAVRTRKKR